MNNKIEWVCGPIAGPNQQRPRTITNENFNSIINQMVGVGRSSNRWMIFREPFQCNSINVYLLGSYPTGRGWRFQLLTLEPVWIIVLVSRLCFFFHSIYSRIILPVSFQLHIHTPHTKFTFLCRASLDSNKYKPLNWTNCSACDGSEREMSCFLCSDVCRNVVFWIVRVVVYTWAQWFWCVSFFSASSSMRLCSLADG